jgi:hypothetical protein
LSRVRATKATDWYRQILNNVQPLGDFVFDVYREMLLHAKYIGNSADERGLFGVDVVHLSNEAHKMKRNRLEYFNADDGRSL